MMPFQSLDKAGIFLLVDIWEFFVRFRVGGGGTKKNKQKSSENDQLTGHFQSFFFSKAFLIFFINISSKTVKLVW